MSTMLKNVLYIVLISFTLSQVAIAAVDQDQYYNVAIHKVCHNYSPTQLKTDTKYKNSNTKKYKHSKHPKVDKHNYKNSSKKSLKNFEDGICLPPDCG